MSSFKQFGVQLAYSHIEKLGDKLEPLQNLIDWKQFQLILDRESSRGRPPYDSIMMFKMFGRGKQTTRNEDGSWTQKNNESYFGYKLHTKMELGNDFITEFAVTTAKVHDGQIDLSKEDEVVYRDKGYSDIPTKAKGNASMKKATRGHKLSVVDILRNERISKKRKKGERPYAVIKVVMKGAHTLYTEIHRVFTQQLLNCFIYNLFQLKRLA